jgi:predicted NUDIX family NTP pyrophosphohydrolase
LIDEHESAADAARRETQEELGLILHGAPQPLATIRQAGGKIVEAFVLEQDIDPSTIESNMFELEWPPRSGRHASFPEIDEARWLSLEAAEQAMLKSQKPLIDALRYHLQGKAV